MGVDCNICLPHTARVGDAADVLASLAGCPGGLKPLGSGHGSAFWSDGIIKIEHFEGGNLESCLDVTIQAPPTWALVTGQQRINAMWFFDFNVGPSLWGLSHGHEGRGFKGRSTGFWIAAGRALVDFFGGAVDYNDCDTIDVDFARMTRPDLAAHDGAAFQDFQNRKAAVLPLTKAELAWAEELAAYKNAGAMR